MKNTKPMMAENTPAKDGYDEQLQNIIKFNEQIPEKPVIMTANKKVEVEIVEKEVSNLHENSNR